MDYINTVICVSTIHDHIIEYRELRERERGGEEKERRIVTRMIRIPILFLYSVMQLIFT